MQKSLRMSSGNVRYIVPVTTAPKICGRKTNLTRMTLHDASFYLDRQGWLHRQTAKSQAQEDHTASCSAIAILKYLEFFSELVLLQTEWYTGTWTINRVYCFPSQHKAFEMYVPWAETPRGPTAWELSRHKWMLCLQLSRWGVNSLRGILPLPLRACCEEKRRQRTSKKYEQSRDCTKHFFHLPYFSAVDDHILKNNDLKMKGTRQEFFFQSCLPCL